MSPKSEGEKKLLIFCIQKAYLHILILFRQTEIIIILEIKISIKTDITVEIIYYFCCI